MSKSSLLTHWTGKDISKNTMNLDSDISRVINNISTKESHDYVDRIISIIAKGLWMTVPKESIIGHSPGDYCRLKYETAMTCFTELRLSEAEKHCKKYGLAGIVVDRKFLLDRLGGPVLYVRSRPQEALVGNMKVAIEYLEKMHTGKVTIATGCQISSEDAIECLKQIIANMKSMSFIPKTDPASTEDLSEENFEYIDEHEWRITHKKSLVDNSKIISYSGDGDGIRPQFLIPMTVSDLKMILVPNELSRKLLLEKDEYKFCLDKTYIPCLTLEEALEL